MSRTRPGATDQRCTDPQGITESRARALLRALLPEIMRRVRPVLAEHLRALAADDEAGALADCRRSLQAKREQLAVLEEEWYGDDALKAGLRPSLNIRHRITALGEEIEELAAQLVDAEASAEAQRDTLRQAEVFAVLNDPMAVFDAMPADTQALLYRLLLRDVQIRGHGWASGRRHEVVGSVRSTLEDSVLARKTAGS